MPLLPLILYIFSDSGLVFYTVGPVPFAYTILPCAETKLLFSWSLPNTFLPFVRNSFFGRKFCRRMHSQYRVLKPKPFLHEKTFTDFNSLANARRQCCHR